MGSMKIAICDDDDRDIDTLRAMIVEHPSGMEDIATYSSADELLGDYADGKRYDLVFLDIQMGETDGYSAAESLFRCYKDEFPLIIFVTVTDKYVYNGYDVRAFGYFTKPVDKKRLFEKLDQANEEISSGKIIILADGKKIIIPVKEIKYIEARNNKLTIFTDSTEYSTRMTLEGIWEKLPKATFARPHRCYIVNLARVSRYDDTYIYFDDAGGADKAFISRQQRKGFVSAMDAYLRR